MASRRQTNVQEPQHVATAWTQHWQQYAKTLRGKPVATPEETSSAYQANCTRSYLSGDTPDDGDWRITARMAQRGTRRLQLQQARDYVSNHAANKQHLMRYTRDHLTTVASALSLRPHQLLDPGSDEDDYDNDYDRTLDRHMGAHHRPSHASKGVPTARALASRSDSAALAAAAAGAAATACGVGCRCKACRARTRRRSAACDDMIETSVLLKDAGYRRALVAGDAEAILAATEAVMDAWDTTTLDRPATTLDHHHHHGITHHTSVHHAGVHPLRRYSSPGGTADPTLPYSVTSLSPHHQPHTAASLDTDYLTLALAQCRTARERAAYVDALLDQLSAKPRPAALIPGLLSLLADEDSGAHGNDDRVTPVAATRPTTRGGAQSATRPQSAARTPTATMRGMMAARSPWATSNDAQQQQQQQHGQAKPASAGDAAGRGRDAYVLQEIRRKVAGQTLRRDLQPFMDSVKTIKRQERAHGNALTPKQQHADLIASTSQRTLQRALLAQQAPTSPTSSRPGGHRSGGHGRTGLGATGGSAFSSVGLSRTGGHRAVTGYRGSDSGSSNSSVVDEIMRSQSGRDRAAAGEREDVQGGGAVGRRIAREAAERRVNRMVKQAKQENAIRDTYGAAPALPVWLDKRVDIAMTGPHKPAPDTYGMHSIERRVQKHLARRQSRSSSDSEDSAYQA